MTAATLPARPSPRAPATFAAWLALGEWRAQPVRASLSVVAIALGVALGFAVHLVNAVALDRFTGGVNRLRGAADLQVTATSPAGFEENLYPRIVLDPTLANSIAVASPVVVRDVVLAEDPSVTLSISGIDALRAVRVTPRLVGAMGSAGDAAGFLDPDAIRVPRALLDRLHRKVGDALMVRVDRKLVVLRIAGIVEGDDATLRAKTFAATMDIAGAQWRLDRLGRLSRIDLALAEGADVPRVRAALAALLPPGTGVAGAADDRERATDLSRAYRVNLDMLALMALFTGAFLVYSTQSLAVARRRAELALLRVVGATRRRVVGQVLVEGAVQGGLGVLLGLALGVGLAALAIRYGGGDLGGGYFARATLDIRALLLAAPDAAALFAVLGLAAALVGSFLPARAAVRTAPALALKAAGDDAGERASIGVAATLLAAGVVAAFLPALDGLPIAGYVAMALLLFGGVAAMPWIAEKLLAPFARRSSRHSVPVELALRRLHAAPSAAAVALCGIVASASLMVAMTVMIASFRDSVDAWLGELLRADVYLRTDSPDDGLDDADAARLARVAGVARVDLQRVVPLTLAPERPTVTLIARTVADDARASIPLVSVASDLPPGSTPVWVSEAVVDLYGARRGQPIALPLAGGPYVVAGVWRDYARQFGSIVMRRPDYVRATHDERAPDAAFTLAAGADPGTTIEALQRALPGSLHERATFTRPAEIRRLSLAIFDRSFAVTYLLQAVAIAIGLAGVAATFSAQTIARAREFGMLRHVGVTRRQVALELAIEGALLGVVGALAGGALGLAMSQVLVHVVNPQSFHWTMDTTIPVATLATIGLALVVASAGAAVAAGRLALSRDAILAVREDW